MKFQGRWTMTAGDNPKPTEKIDKRRLLLYLLVTPLFLALFFFLPAGTWTWVRGWAFIGIFAAAVTVSTWYLRRANPDLVAARINRHEGTVRWDKVLLSFFFVAWFSILPVAALDDERFEWFPTPWWVCVLGYALCLIGFGIVTWAESVNKFFEPTVRIQTDRGQKVIDRGPYAIVRHPGYVGGVLFSVGVALSLGSLWALLPATLASSVLVLRTKWEDKMLQEKLAGYQDYAQRVRYRLIPRVW